MYADFVTCVVVGLGLLLFGRWASRHTADLTPATLEAREWRKRERSLFRGAVTCQIAGIALVVVSTLLLLL